MRNKNTIYMKKKVTIKARIIIGALCVLLFLPVAIFAIVIQPTKTFDIVIIVIYFILVLCGIWAIVSGIIDLIKENKTYVHIRDHREQEKEDELSEISGYTINDNKNAE